MSTFVESGPRLVFRSGLAGLACLVLPFAASAQTSADDDYALEEILVTAEKIESTAQETSRSISVMDTTELTAIGAITLQDALANVPGFGYGGGLFGQPAMRGIGLGNTDTNQMASIVAINVDGAPSFGGARGGSNSGVENALFDVDRVEIVHGPSGTMVGQNALAGSVNVVTRKPILGEWGFNADVGFGNYQQKNYTLGANIPLGDTVAFRLAYNHSEHDCYGQVTDGTNTVCGESWEDMDQSRIKMLWQPTDNFSVVLTANKQQDNSNMRGMTGNPDAKDPWLGAPMGPPGATASEPARNPGPKDTNYSAEISWATEVGTLTVTPTYTRSEPSDNRPDFCFGPGAPVGGPCAIPQVETRKGYEARFNGSLADDKLEYVVGYLEDNQEINGGFATGGSLGEITVANLNFGQVTPNYLVLLDDWGTSNPGVGVPAYINGGKTYPPRNTKSVYANFTYSITDQLRLIAGIRSAKDNSGGSYEAYAYTIFIPEGGLDATEWTYTAQNGVLPNGTIYNGIPDPDLDAGLAGTNNNEWTCNNCAYYIQDPFQYVGETSPDNYSVGVEWDWTDANMLYFNWNTGYQPGGVELNLVPAQLYPAQEIDAYALGSKNRFMDNRLELNVEAYLYDYKNFHANADYYDDMVADIDGTTYVRPGPVPYASGEPLNGILPYPLNYNPPGLTFRQAIPSMTHYGLEADMRALLSPNDSITANIALLHHMFTDFVDTSGFNYKGQRLAHAPATTARVSYTHDFHVFNGMLSPRMDVKFQSNTIIANQRSWNGQSILEAVTQKSFWKYDAYLNYQSDENGWGANVYVKNIENTAQKTAKFPFGDPWISQPRTYGVTFSYNF